MKTKIIILTILSLFIFSCKSDDEGLTTSEISENEKYLNEITGQDLSIKLNYSPIRKLQATLAYESQEFVSESSVSTGNSSPSAILYNYKKL